MLRVANMNSFGTPNPNPNSKYLYLKWPENRTLLFVTEEGPVVHVADKSDQVIFKEADYNGKTEMQVGLAKLHMEAWKLKQHYQLETDELKYVIGELKQDSDLSWLVDYIGAESFEHLLQVLAIRKLLQAYHKNCLDRVSDIINEYGHEVEGLKSLNTYIDNIKMHLDYLEYCLLMFYNSFSKYVNPHET